MIHRPANLGGPFSCATDLMQLTAGAVRWRPLSYGCAVSDAERLAFQQLLDYMAHECLLSVVAENLRLDATMHGYAISDSHGVRLVVFAAPYDGPLRLHLNPGVTLEKLFTMPLPGDEPGNPAGNSAPLPFPLRDVEAAALQAAPGSAERPVTVKKLAVLAGYRDTDHFREAVRQLVDRGYLERVRGGVRRRSAPG